jgi:hypothetical protein
MRTKKLLTCLFVPASLVGLAATGVADQVGVAEPEPSKGAAPLAPLRTGFTYQGELQGPGGPVTGDCDLGFRLWTAADLGAQVGSTVTLNAVDVTDGLLTAEVDFG